MAAVKPMYRICIARSTDFLRDCEINRLRNAENRLVSAMLKVVGRAAMEREKMCARLVWRALLFDGKTGIIRYTCVQLSAR